MFGISMWELCLILLVGLIVLGPRQLAEVAKAAGKVYREIQNMSWDFRRSIDLELKSTRESSSPPYTPPVTPDEKGPDATDATGLLPGERTGPDFYADLLEQASEKDKKAQEGEETEEVSPESKPSDAEAIGTADAAKEGK